MRTLLAAALLLAACSVRTNDLSPLANAAREGNAKAIGDLCARGADPNAPSGDNGWTPLLHAVHKNQLDSVRALLGAGANPDLGSRSGMTPLMMAAGYGNQPMVGMLLRGGARADVRDHDGAVALDYALTGVTDIDDFTFFRCQGETASALAKVSPEAQRSSLRWARIKGC
jgi:ankyrin repeat protein